MITLCFVLYSVVTAVTGHFDPHFYANRTSIVHLFEWKWYDVAEECENFLQHKGYGGVQISPPNENIIISSPSRPWWERYQPVSYILSTRSGDETAFRNMTKRCNDAGVRIYVDAVINHMAGTSGTGTAGSKSDWERKNFPAVPYGPDDFHESCNVKDYRDVTNVRNCDLLGLRDLNHGKEHVRRAIIKYLNRLIDLGVAGFRIDAAKHMWPGELNEIINNLKDLNTDFGFRSDSRPFIFQEVIDHGGEGVHIRDYTDVGAVTEFKYARSITNVFQGKDKLTYVDSWGPRWGFLDGVAVVFVDNHDTQRDFGTLTYKDPKRYKMATAFMLAHPYGIPKVMSSFDFKDKDQGPPQDAKGNILSPNINSDGTCSEGFICEHRWRQVYNMAEFRNIVKGTPVTNFWSNGDQQISFCRGDKGFIAITNRGNLIANLQTCLPPGKYCDVISGDLVERRCTGKVVTVDGRRDAFVSILADDEDGVLAIHVNSKLNG